MRSAPVMDTVGGELQRVEIVPLSAAIDFNRFAVEQAKCFDPNDKAKLLTAIESAFGAYGPFNALMRRQLTSASGKAADTPVKWTKKHRSSKRGVVAVEVLAGAREMWVAYGGASLEPLLRSGAIAVLNAQWVIALSKAGGTISRRQDLPDEAFLTPDELIAAGTANNGLRLALVS